MVTIESHIENLLLCYDCVIVPGIGGFVTRYEDSTFLTSGTEMAPPYRSVSFNSQLKANDGLLTHSYMTTYDTNYPKAQQLLDDDVCALRDTLHRGQPCKIGNIGTLQQTQSGALIFTPNDEQIIYTKEFYGLTDCAIAPARNIAPSATTIATPIAAKPTTQPATNPLATTRNMKKVNTDNSGTTHDDNHYVIRLNKNAVRYTVAAIAAAMLYFVFSIAPTVSLNNSNLQEAAIIGSSKQAPAVEKVAPVAKTATQPKAQAPVKATKPIVKPTPAPATKATTPALKAITPTVSIDNTPETIYFG